MKPRISLGVLFCGVACAGHSNDLGTIHSSGGATMSVSPAEGGATQTTSSATGGAAIGGDSSTGSVATGGTAIGGDSSTGSVAAGGAAIGGDSSMGSVATGGTAIGGDSSTGTTVTGGFAATGGNMSTGGVPTSGGTFPTGGASATGGASGFVLDLTCKKDTDCCIVSNACSSGFYLVTAAQQNELAARIGTTPTTACPACIPPQVVVSCDTVRGICIGEELTTYDPQSPLSKPHCGLVADAGSMGGATPAPSPGVVPASAPDAALGGGISTGGTTSAPQTRFGCG